MSALPISFEDVLDARARIADVAHVTPVLTSRTLDERIGGSAFLKVEALQCTGAFKFRGAYNRVSRLSDDERARGVASFSSGNHAGALALAAREVGTHAVIVMPEDAPEVKRAATAGYGAEIVPYDRYTQSREEIGYAIAAERGLTVVPPYDDPFIMAGQGTAAAELCEEVADLDVLVVPIGGGGLISGCATAAKAMARGIRVIGVEPAAADDAKRSLGAGHRVEIDVPRSIADGLLSPSLGELTYEVVAALVDEIVTVTDDQIVEAMRLLFERMKLVVEPSGAVGVAAMLAGAIDVSGARAGVIVSGGNVGAERFAELLG